MLITSFQDTSNKRTSALSQHRKIKEKTLFKQKCSISFGPPRKSIYSACSCRIDTVNVCSHGTECCWLLKRASVMPTDAKICYTHCFHPKISVHCHFEGNNLRQACTFTSKLLGTCIRVSATITVCCFQLQCSDKWIYMAVYL